MCFLMSVMIISYGDSLRLILLVPDQRVRSFAFTEAIFTVEREEVQENLTEIASRIMKCSSLFLFQLLDAVLFAI